MFIHENTYIHIYIYMYIYIYTHAYQYTHTHPHTHTGANTRNLEDMIKLFTTQVRQAASAFPTRNIMYTYI